MTRPSRRHAARAPVRVDLTGGATDCRPFVDHHEAWHVSVALDLYARAQASEGDPDSPLGTESSIVELSEDGGARVPARSGLTGLVREIRGGFDAGHVAVGVSLDAPPGSGLGTSAAVGVVVTAAVSAHVGAQLSRDEVVSRAADAERAAGNPGGWQDQYASAYGGACLWGITPDRVRRLRLNAHAVGAMCTDMLLALPGGERASGVIVSQIADSLRAGDSHVWRAHHDLNSLAFPIAEALNTCDRSQLSALLAAVLDAQSRLHPSVVDVSMQAAVEVPGVVAGKPCGGGGRGAAWLLLCEQGASGEVTSRLEASGLTIMQVRPGGHALVVRNET